MKIKILLAVALVAIFGTLSAGIERFENEQIIRYSILPGSHNSNIYTNVTFYKGSGEYSDNSYRIVPSAIKGIPLRSIGHSDPVGTKKLFEQLENSYNKQEEKKLKKAREKADLMNKQEKNKEE